MRGLKISDERLTEAWNGGLSEEEICRLLSINIDYLRKRWRWLRHAGLLVENHRVARPLEEDFDRAGYLRISRDLLLERLRRYHGGNK